MMSIFAFFVPVNSPSGTASEPGTGRKLLVSGDYGSRRAFHMQPCEVAGESARERLDKRQSHDQKTSVHGVELRLDPRANHVGKRDAQCSAKHQVRNDTQLAEEDPQPEKENR